MNELIPPVGERDHYQGSLDAPTILVEYGDYECPHCKAAVPVVKALQAELGDKLCFVYRHFPLVEIHPNAEPAAEAAEAAGAQGAFWAMHDTLFQHSPALSLRNVVAYAEVLGLDTAQFRQEVRTNVHLPRIQQDIESGAQSGVSGTPTFFINGLRHRGGYDYAELLEALKVAR